MRHVLMIRPSGSPFVAVPGSYPSRPAAENAREEILKQDANVQVLIVPVYS